MKHENAVRMLISFFNMQFGTRYKVSSNGDSFDAVIADDEGNVSEIRKAIKDWGAKKDNDIRHFLNWYKYEYKTEAKVAASVPQAVTGDASEINLGISILSKTVAQMVAQVKSEEIKQTVADELKAKIDSYILETYGKIEKQVTLISEFGKHEVEGVQHKMFDTVLKFVANDEPVYLAGPAGSGKNVMCKQVAEALGIDFYFTNAVTQEYKLTGFTDANGTFHESQFYKAFKNGGLFMLDEMDASIPEVLIILNAAIANRYFDFPAPIGKIEAHKDFRVIAAGNTLGHGADSNYVGRNTLDAASLDRFALVEVDYDDRIEMSVTNNNVALVNFCRAFRKAADKAGLQVVVSYRAMSRMAKMESMLSKQDLLKSCLVKGLELDDLNAIKKDLQGYGEYSAAFAQIINERA